MNENLKLREFLEISRKVTENYVEAKGKFGESYNDIIERLLN